MTPKLIKTELAQYVRGEWDGTPSPIRAITDHVVVQVDRVAEQTVGGIFITPLNQDQQNVAAESGVVVSTGPDVNYLADGDHVHFSRYAGQLFMRHRGDDDRATPYRLMSASEIGAVSAD